MWIEVRPTHARVCVELKARDVASGRSECQAYIHLNIEEAKVFMARLQHAIAGAEKNAEKLAEEAYKDAVAELAKAEARVADLRKLVKEKSAA